MAREEGTLGYGDIEGALDMIREGQCPRMSRERLVEKLVGILSESSPAEIARKFGFLATAFAGAMQHLAKSDMPTVESVFRVSPTGGELLDWLAAGREGQELGTEEVRVLCIEVQEKAISNLNEKMKQHIHHATNGEGKGDASQN